MQQTEEADAGKGKRTRGDSTGKAKHGHTHNAYCVEVCNNYSRGACNMGDSCQRAHQCSKCLGQHPANKCQVTFGKDGKGKRRRGHDGKKSNGKGCKSGKADQAQE